jgi:NAD(P) transhydrogenase subunit alpha
MMKIAVLKEGVPQEKRIAITPSVVKKFTDMGAQVHIESGLGQRLFFSDEDYRREGAVISADKKELLTLADIIVRVQCSPVEDIALLKKQAVHISFFNFQEKELTSAFSQQKVTALSLEKLPRTTLAQKMDALSSQASLSGYVAVILAAEKLHKVFPMMTTPAGTIFPVTVFVIGVGVAGLQAIATAKRLGARVMAFDTRAVVQEQVESLGAKFVTIDLGKTGQTKDGYAKALTEEQLVRQKEQMLAFCAQSDIVITTAQVMGKRAPILVTKQMIDHMKPGSVIVDAAIDSGGNVEQAKKDQLVVQNGVTIIGYSNLPGKIPVDASQMYAMNVFHLIEHCYQDTTSSLNLEDPLLHACIVTHVGKCTVS